MIENPLKSINSYSSVITELFNRPTMQWSAVSVWPTSPYAGIAEGEVFSIKGFKLRLREELDFEKVLIRTYGYEVFSGEKKLYWYDDFPHPNDPALAETFPHHKHVPPDIKRNRIPAPEISFSQPNLPAIIRGIEELLGKDETE